MSLYDNDEAMANLGRCLVDMEQGQRKGRGGNESHILAELRRTVDAIEEEENSEERH